MTYQHHLKRSFSKPKRSFTYLISKWLLLSAFSFLLLSGCSEVSPIEELRWLEGNWKQVNQKGSRLSLESWTYKNGELIGNGYTVDNSSDAYDTLFSEDIRIIVREQKLFYEAILPNQPAVIFRLTEAKQKSKDGNWLHSCRW